MYRSQKKTKIIDVAVKRGAGHGIHAFTHARTHPRFHAFTHSCERRVDPPSGVLTTSSFFSFLRQWWARLKFLCFCLFLVRFQTRTALFGWTYHSHHRKADMNRPPLPRRGIGCLHSLWTPCSRSKTSGASGCDTQNHMYVRYIYRTYCSSVDDGKHIPRWKGSSCPCRRASG